MQEQTYLAEERSGLSCFSGDRSLSEGCLSRLSRRAAASESTSDSGLFSVQSKCGTDARSLQTRVHSYTCDMLHGINRQT